MPPCTKAKKAPGIPPMPQVSSKELETARKTLDTNEERKKCRSSMMHWLKKEGYEASCYNKLMPAAKKDFMQLWLSCY